MKFTSFFVRCDRSIAGAKRFGAERARLASARFFFSARCSVSARRRLSLIGGGVGSLAASAATCFLAATERLERAFAHFLRRILNVGSSPKRIPDHDRAARVPTQHPYFWDHTPSGLPPFTSQCSQGALV